MCVRVWVGCGRTVDSARSLTPTHAHTVSCTPTNQTTHPYLVTVSHSHSLTVSLKQTSPLRFASLHFTSLLLRPQAALTRRLHRPQTQTQTRTQTTKHKQQTPPPPPPPPPTPPQPPPAAPFVVCRSCVRSFVRFGCVLFGSVRSFVCLFVRSFVRSFVCLRIERSFQVTTPRDTMQHGRRTKTSREEGAAGC